MSFFKRDDREEVSKLPALPGLPELPTLPELPALENQNSQIQQPNQIPPLPSFPRTAAGESFNIEAIKSNVSENKSESSDRRTLEMPNSSSAPSQIRYSPKDMRSEEPLFIKLDKFKEAIKKFEEIKTKVNDIDNSLKRIREVKDKEDQEIKDWENEIREVKDKIGNIDSSLFNNV